MVVFYGNVFDWVDVFIVNFGIFMLRGGILMRGYFGFNLFLFILFMLLDGNIGLFLVVSLNGLFGLMLLCFNGGSKVVF